MEAAGFRAWRPDGAYYVMTDIAGLTDDDDVDFLPPAGGITGRRGCAAGDLGVRKAIARWFSDDPIWPEARVREACLGFGEHANLAVHYLLAPDAEPG